MSIPGLEDLDYLEVSSGGSDIKWVDFDQRKHYTNAFIITNGKTPNALSGSVTFLDFVGLQEERLWYNGFGGKVDAGETPIQAAKRELMEESGIEAPLEHAGTLLFLIAGVQWAFHIDIYRAESFSGNPVETEEIRPQWFSTGDSNSTGTEPPIPYDKLWESDYLWFPLLLEKQKFIVRTDYVRDGDRDLLQKWCVKKKSSNAS
ncbi:hypothetical protein HWV62_9331 [Athelia sp. TMB]|nr:hypothetical protein HWV62_9331 [Athelia sp. TMB]